MLYHSKEFVLIFWCSAPTPRLEPNCIEKSTVGRQCRRELVHLAHVYQWFWEKKTMGLAQTSAGWTNFFNIVESQQEKTFF